MSAMNVMAGLQMADFAIKNAPVLYGAGKRIYRGTKKGVRYAKKGAQLTKKIVKAIQKRRRKRK
jgi:hypothetical protein